MALNDKRHLATGCRFRIPSTNPLFAHDLRTSLCFRSASGCSERQTIFANTAPGPCLHGPRAHRRDVIQSIERLDNRSTESADCESPSASEQIDRLGSACDQHNWISLSPAPRSTEQPRFSLRSRFCIIFLYSLTKRFTNATHFFLGFALAIAPIGAWIAQTGRLDLPPLVLGAGVLCWVAGFDLIYATQDIDFDRREGLRSLVVKIGINNSLRLAQWLHLLMFFALLGFGLAAHLGAIYFAAMPLIAGALFYEHRCAKKLDLAGINKAFFQSNAFVSVLFVVAVLFDRFV